MESINRRNVGRIAERIVSNELEYRGFRVSDLNKEGTSANADLLAARDGQTWQIQVKGATQDIDGEWVSYGFCNDAIIAKKEPMFNRHVSNFYMAQVVVLLSIKAPKHYSSLVLPVEIAEEAAQMNLDREYRTRKRDGGIRKPNRVWAWLDKVPPGIDEARKTLLKKEQAFFKPYRDNWNCLENGARRASA